MLLQDPPSFIFTLAFGNPEKFPVGLQVFPSVYQKSLISTTIDEPDPCGICDKQDVVMACIQCGFGFCLSCAQSFHACGKMRDHDLVVLASSVNNSDNNSPMLTPSA